MGPIHYFDIVFLVAALALVIMGMIRGFIGEVVRLLAVVGGLATGLMLYRQVYPFMKILNISASAKICIAFILLFFVGYVAILLLGWAAQKLVRLSMLDWVDRAGGALFGFLKAVVIIWVFVRSVESSPFTSMQKGFRPSLTYAILAALPPKVMVPYFDRSSRSAGRLLGKDPVRAVEKEFSNVRLKVDSAMAARDSTSKTVKTVRRPPLTVKRPPPPER